LAVSAVWVAAGRLGTFAVEGGGAAEPLADEPVLSEGGVAAAPVPLLLVAALGSPDGSAGMIVSEFLSGAARTTRSVSVTGRIATASAPSAASEATLN